MNAHIPNWIRRAKFPWNRLHGQQPIRQRSCGKPPCRRGVETLEQRVLLAGGFSNASISDPQMEALLDGLDGFVTFGRGLSETGELAQPIALIRGSAHEELSPGSLANIGDAIHQKLVTPIRSYLESTDPATRDTAGLVAFIDSLSEVTSIDGGQATSPTNEFRFELSWFDETSLGTVGLAFDDTTGAESAGISTDDTTDISLNTSLQFTVAFGIDLNPDLNSEQAFFLRDPRFDL